MKSCVLFLLSVITSFSSAYEISFNNSGSDDCITMDKLKKNMPQWVDLVPYSHAVNRDWGYPTDCSGFVSWALQTPNKKAYEYSSDKYSTKIDTDDLQYGDIITKVSCDNDKVEGEESDADPDNLGSDYISGHVFFFDKWDDDDHENFWAYESTETQDQTEACLAQNNPVTRSECLNHHVKKERKIPDKWSKKECESDKYGTVTGGPRRLSKKLLCQ